MGINEATFFSLFSTLSIRREVTVFFYQSEVKESSGMLRLIFVTASFTCDLQQSKMARSSKRQKRSVISRRRRLFQRFCFNFEKFSFVMKTTMLRKIHKLGVAYEKYEKELLLFHGSPRISFC